MIIYPTGEFAKVSRIWVYRILSSGPAAIFPSFNPERFEVRNQSKSTGRSRRSPCPAQFKSRFLKSAISSDICEDKNKICDPKKMFKNVILGM